jgi:hypothetical protein
LKPQVRFVNDSDDLHDGVGGENGTSEDVGVQSGVECRLLVDGGHGGGLLVRLLALGGLDGSQDVELEAWRRQ